MKKFVLLSVWSMLLTSTTTVHAQKKNDKFYLATVAFYNIENLFDIYDDPETNDKEFLPDGKNNWTEERYNAKLERISEIIEKLGDDDGPEILGLCEVENKKVVEDLINTKRLKHMGYDIVHYNSPDRRGIDVALVYKKKYFTPISSKSIRLRDTVDADFLSRDQLLVTGILSNDTISFIVNHWPSRRGGKPDKRILAAITARRTVDSLLAINQNAKIILMGDFNDDPDDISMKKYLEAVPMKKFGPNSLFNAMYPLYRKGLGSLAYRDNWNLFDQIVMTQPLLDMFNGKYYYMSESAGIYAPSFIRQQEGRFAGYPFRTFVGSDYKGGYSDHFPVFIYLVQKVE